MKGFGFITPESGPDLFVHLQLLNGLKELKALLLKSLKEGQKVTFVVVNGQRSMQAEMVRVLG